MSRTIAAVVPGFPDALRIARASDVVAQVPKGLVCTGLPGTSSLGEGLARLRASYGDGTASQTTFLCLSEIQQERVSASCSRTAAVKCDASSTSWR